jgi:hypothetical protein
VALVAISRATQVPSGNRVLTIDKGGGWRGIEALPQLLAEIERWGIEALGIGELELVASEAAWSG